MKDVLHSGKILAVNPEFTSVELLESNAHCTGCHAVMLCGMGKVKKKVVQVQTDPLTTYEVGETVQVILTGQMGLKAVWIGYIAPLVILLVLLLVMIACHADELVAGLTAGGTVALYYLVLYLLRSRLVDEYIFTIKKLKP